MNPDIIQVGEKIHDALVEKTNFGWNHNLNGACAVGSYFLLQELEKRSITCSFMLASNRGRGLHAWVESDGIIYDVTAIQFDHTLPKVYVVDLYDLHGGLPERIYQRRSDYFSSSEENITFVNTTWIREQRPENYRLEWEEGHARIISMKQLPFVAHGQISLTSGMEEVT